jgi:hypothetical protein
MADGIPAKDSHALNKIRISRRVFAMQHALLSAIEETAMEAATTFRIRGLAPAPFQPLFALTDAELAERGVQRMRVDAYPGFPCRVSLEDAPIGESMLLLNWQHLESIGPYRASGPIFVHENAHASAEFDDAVPEQLRRRLLSVRAYDDGDMMRAAEVLQGDALETQIRKYFADPAIRYLHVHNARPGCFACRIDRA